MVKKCMSAYDRVYKQRKDLTHSIMDNFCERVTEIVKLGNKFDCQIAFTFEKKFYLVGDLDSLFDDVLYLLLSKSIKELNDLKYSDSLFNDLKVRNYTNNKRRR